MKITFYPRGQVVQARMSDGAQCYRISTGINIQPHHKFIGEFKGKTLEVSQLNTDLSRCKIKLTELYIEHKDFKKVKDLFFEKAPELPIEEGYNLNDLLRKYVIMMAKGELLSNSKKKYSQSSIEMYSYVSKLLNEFSYYYKPIDIREYHIEPTWESAKKREVANNYNHYWKKYEDFLIDRGLGLKTRSDLLNMTGVMTKYWSNYFFFANPKIPRLNSHEKAIIVLPSEFVIKFLNDEDKMYNKFSPEDKFVWEISATILITTLRIGDALSLSQKDLNISKDLVFMRKKNEKTGVYSEMPLPQTLANIYRENLARYGRIYSVPPERTAVYGRIKQFFKTYEDMHEIMSVAQFDIRGEEYIVSKPLWEWVHPHLLRKTAITTMIYNKVPERFIKFASGHAVNSSAFERYVGHVEKYYKSEMNDYYGKIFN